MRIQFPWTEPIKLFAPVLTLWAKTNKLPVKANSLKQAALFLAKNPLKHAAYASWQASNKTDKLRKELMRDFKCLAAKDVALWLSAIQCFIIAGSCKQTTVFIVLSFPQSRRGTNGRGSSHVKTHS